MVVVVVVVAVVVSVAHEHARAERRTMLEDSSELGPLLEPARAHSSGLGMLERSWHARA